MTEILKQFHEFQIENLFRTIVLLLIGYFIARFVSASLPRVFSKRITRQQSMILSRASFYLIFILFIVSAIQQMGFNIGTLLGATGIVTIAIGIASQTSFSNIVSGIFILGEKPFELGNTIRVNDIEGEVLSIDLLSVKIRTFDNTMVRIPNETLVKSAITNLSYFSKRRVDILIGVAYKENLNNVKNILLETATKNSFCLVEPVPTFLITGFGDSAINIKFGVWADTNNYNEVKNSIQEDIKNAFAAAGIEIPFPCRTLFAGSHSEPLPIKVVS